VSKKRRLLIIVGVRPQFVKVAPLLKALESSSLEPILMHTGQHYDYRMSEVFFEELGLGKADIHAECGAGSHAEQTARMLVDIESALRETSPAMVIVFGDTNSTLAGALAASKLHVPVAHIEAGLRSYNREMPEEINRVLVDHISTLLFCPSGADVARLKSEGIVEGVLEVGDVMRDSVRRFLDLALQREDLAERHSLVRQGYGVATLHRPSNVDASGVAMRILGELDRIGLPIIVPTHPRLRRAIGDARFQNVILEDPFGYLDMMKLCHDASFVATDSGGLQKEAYWLKTPCFTLRSETEWTEILDTGWGQLAPPLQTDLKAVCSYPERPDRHPDLYGDGYASERIVSAIIDWMESAR